MSRIRAHLRYLAGRKEDEKREQRETDDDEQKQEAKRADAPPTRPRLLPRGAFLHQLDFQQLRELCWIRRFRFGLAVAFYHAAKQ